MLGQRVQPDNPTFRLTYDLIPNNPVPHSRYSRAGYTFSVVATL